MRKSTFLLSLGVMASMLASPVSAQTIQLHRGEPLKVMPKLTAKERAARQKAFAAQYPLVAQRKSIKHVASPFREVRPNIPFRPSVAKKAAGLTATGSIPFWTILAYSQGWPVDEEGNVTNQGGIYEMTTGSSVSFEPLAMNPSMIQAGGAAVQDGVYYHMSADFSYAQIFGIVLANLYSYDIETWEPTAESGASMSSNMELIAVETAQAADGTTYGEFYTSDLSALEYGIVDYAAKSRTTIGTATHTMVALGVTNDGRLYGVATDGNFYQISTIDGTETLIGATGLTISDEEGYYGQTGEVDPQTNTFYWSAIETDGTSGLYTIDLATGQATQIGSFADGEVQTYDMISPGKTADENAPAKAENLIATFANGSTSGTLTFTAPSKTYGGADLTGNLDYVVSVNNVETANGTTSAGEATTVSLTDVPEGMVKFSVVTANAAGLSPKSNVSAWVGYDVPVAPANVNLVVDADKKATVTWDAVTEGMHSGYVAGVTYDVVRIAGKDSTTIATGINATTATDQISGPLASYVYAVRAHNGSRVSAWANSNGEVVGEAMEVPYFEGFDNEANFSLFTVIDANNDGRGWQYVAPTGYTFPGSVYYRYSAENPGDDWLITPPIKLTAGREYVISYIAQPYSKNYPERLEVKYGSSATVEGMTTELLPSTDITEKKVYTQNFTPAAAGNYFFGFHAISDKDEFYLDIDSISIELGALPTSPAAPTINVIPDATGALTAKVRVTAPSTQIDGNPLAGLSKIVLKRDGAVIHEFANPAPGATVEFDDVVTKDGTYNYTAIPYVGEEYGHKGEARAFIGVDIPLDPQNATAADLTSSIKITWDAIGNVGANGGLVDPAGVTTYLYDVTPDGYLSDEPTDSVVNGTSFTVTFNTNEGDPDLKLFGLLNANRAGSTSAISVGLPVGLPATLPFRESVSGGELVNNWWLERDGGSSYTNAWAFTTESSADNDGGSFIYTATADSVSSSINTYKVSLKGASNPMLIFSDRLTGATSATAGSASVGIQTPDGVTTVEYSKEFNGDTDWTEHIVDLSSYASYDWVLVKFIGTSDVAPVNYGLDKIIIADVYDDDLSAELTAPERVVKGQTINATVKITNEGRNDQSSYTLNVYADDAVVKTIAVDKTLKAFSDTTIVVAVPTSPVSEQTEMKVKAEVVLDADLELDNNVSEATVALATSTKPTVESATRNGNDIEWVAPTASSEEVTEDFESYEPFVNPFGDWTTIDGNPEASRGGFFQSYTYPGQGAAGSFVVFNADAIVEGAFDQNEGLRGHEESRQFAGMPYEYIGEEFVDGDNYLVSPMLSGEAQTIKFYARNQAPDASTDYPESFTVLASSTDNTKEAFTTTVKPTTTLTGGQWQEFTVDLPEGTRYFAIHQTSSGSGAGNFLLSVDDVTYKVGSDMPVGYNIYRDGELVGHVDGSGNTTYTDSAAPEGTHTWSVTAVYADGEESAPVEAQDVTAITEIVKDGKPFDVYTLGGVRVLTQTKSLNGLAPGVYIVNNHKVIVK